MASNESILLCAAAMVVLWSSIGGPIALRLAPRPVAYFLAPALGWAIYSVLALPIFAAAGMGRSAVVGITAIAFIASAASVLLRRPVASIDRLLLPVAILVICAALLAMAPAAAVVPKFTMDGVALAQPIFDHSKIALVDEMIRSGVPPVNPFFHEVGTTDRVAYYYLWHFSAAALAVITGVSGWEADAALTWFTAFSSLLVTMGIALGLSNRIWSSAIVLFIAATSSVRLPLDWLIGHAAAESAIRNGSGFGGWLFQTSWAPQHTASAVCVVLTALLLPKLAERGGLLLPVVIGLLAAAGFQSSVWAGGVTLALASAVVILEIAWTAGPSGRILPFLGRVGLTAAIAGALSSPFVFDQLVMAGLRGGEFPITIRPVKVLGDGITSNLRAMLDLPAYWLIYLPVELPAYYVAGVVGMFTVARLPVAEGDSGARSLVSFLVTSLIVAWLLASTVGNNNDLGWRAALPAVLLLASFAAAGASVWLDTGARTMVILATAALALGLPEGLAIIKENVVAPPEKSEQLFAKSTELWSAVRRYAASGQRIANNPQFLADMTPWPINISWALLGNRRSCFAGADLALPFAPIPKAHRAELEEQFNRVFAGTPNPDDIEQLANRYKCDVIVVTAQDGAWSNDPFASTPYYKLVEERPEWRIYRQIVK